MKVMIIATLVASTVALSQPAEANPRGHHKRNHSPIEGLVHQLHDLSLSSVQKAEIKSLIEDFKEAQPRPEKPERPALTTLRSASAESIRAQAEEKVSERETQGLKIAELRSQVFAVLTAEQQSTLLARAEDFKDKRNAKRANFSDKKGQGKKPRSPFRGNPFRGIDLSDEQRESLRTLSASFKETMDAHKANMEAFREAQADLVQSGSFSSDAFEALSLRYHDAMVSAEVDKAFNQQAMLAVLTDEQIAELEVQNEERSFFQKLLKRG
ncbi:hypothetical protein GTH32_16905 [Alteromonas sp. 345S023]|uniref:Periplasmic heavy metal sensor n=1 Tax=Alteromonas profundi TaxID=2696062 RepID=A0A7X5RML0_9ALTE|nr:Spy/CpxP family protein refolding chaperone [Alteromonas profundi]NDV92851.1 hypothetical protein [Alteromonas profundi]